MVKSNTLKYYIIEAWETEVDLETYTKLGLDTGIIEQVLPLVSGIINTEIIINF